MKLNIILLSLLCSCSSSLKYDYETLKPNVVMFIDGTNNNFVVRQYYTDTEDKYHKYKESGQINTDKQWSCFGTSKSTNYVAIMSHYVPLFRTLATKQKFTVKYRKADGLNQDYYSRVYSEEKFDEIKVNKKTCSIKHTDKTKYFVISEVYQQE